MDTRRETYAATSVGRQVARGRTGARWAASAEPVDPEGPPVVAVDVPGRPGTSGARRVTSRYGSTCRRLAVPSWLAVLEPQPLAGRGSRRRAWSARRGRPVGRAERRIGTVAALQRADPAPQPGRQHLLELGQRAQRRSPRCRPPPAGRRSAGRPRSPPPPRRRAAAAAGRPRRRAGSRRSRRGVAAHRVAEVAQPVDVAADGPGADAERARPARVPVHSRGVCSRESSRSSRAGGVQHVSACQRYEDGTDPRSCVTRPRHDRRASDRSASTSPRPTSTTCATGSPRTRWPRAAPRRRLAAGRPASTTSRAGRALARPVRLAGAGGAAQRVPAVRHRDRRPATSTSCTSARRSRTRCRCCSPTAGRARSSSSPS